MSEKEKPFKPIVETKDKLFSKYSTNLNVINTYFVYINISDLDENDSKYDFTDSSLSTSPFYSFNDNL